MTPVPRPTAKEVVEAIAVAIEAIREDLAENDYWDGILNKLVRAADTLERHRASLLEKGGPDAPVDQQEHAPGAVVGSDRSGVLVSDQQNVARTLEREAPPAVAPLENVARFTPEERVALRWAAECAACAHRPFAPGVTREQAHQAETIIRRMLAGDDTPGGRT